MIQADARGAEGQTGALHLQDGLVQLRLGRTEPVGRGGVLGGRCFFKLQVLSDLLSIHRPRSSDITHVTKILTATIEQNQFTALKEESERSLMLLNHNLIRMSPFVMRRCYLDDLVVVYVVQSVSSIPSSNHRRVSQEVSTMDPILKIKLKQETYV